MGYQLATMQTNVSNKESVLYAKHFIIELCFQRKLFFITLTALKSFPILQAPGGVVEIKVVFQGLSLDTISNCAFGIETNSFKNPGNELFKVINSDQLVVEASFRIAKMLFDCSTKLAKHFWILFYFQRCLLAFSDLRFKNHFDNLLVKLCEYFPSIIKVLDVYGKDNYNHLNRITQVRRIPELHFLDQHAIPSFNCKFKMFWSFCDS